MNNIVKTSDFRPIIFCRDCEECYYASNRVPDERCWVCSKHGIDVRPDFYCADGERRDEDEKTDFMRGGN